MHPGALSRLLETYTPDDELHAGINADRILIRDTQIYYSRLNASTFKVVARRQPLPENIHTRQPAHSARNATLYNHK